MAAPERSAAAAKLKRRSYNQGDALYEPGTVQRSLSIIASGVVSCTREDDEFGLELARLGPAEYFGEIGLLTNTGSRVRITALTPVAAYELGKDDLAPILAAHPEVSDLLHGSISSRQAIIEPPLLEAADEVRSHGVRSWLSDWLHHRYGMASSK